MIYYIVRMGSAIYCYLLIVRTRDIHNILSRIEHIGVPVYSVTRCPLLLRQTHTREIVTRFREKKKNNCIFSHCRRRVAVGWA